ncbi:MAG: RNA polymerase sigma factor [Bacteroidales bacterium]|nr:RNA polymerase sigma factor [Bacteroidales bacterium]
MSKHVHSGACADMHKDLIEACRKGSRTAQFKIYELYYRVMYNTALRIVGDPDDAEDVMQEAFLKAFRKLDTFSGKVSFGAWLKKIVINQALDFIKLKKTTVSLDAIGERRGEEEEGSEEGEEYSMEWNVGTIKEAILALPEGYRIVLSLYLIEGYDHEEIASILNISNATSRTQYHRAKKKLLESIKKKRI